MSVKARLLIDELEVNVLSFSFGFNQGADSVGRPTQKPIFLGLNLTIETRKDLNLADWALSLNEIKQLELHIYPVILGGKTRVVKFIDCNLLNWENNFSSTGNEPLAETLRISSAGLKDSNSVAEYSSYWRTTMPGEGAEATTLNNDEKELVKYFLTDIEGNEVEEYAVGDKLVLNIETKNRINDKVTIFLEDKSHDFLYQGNILEDDKLKDYVINSDLEQIELEVVIQSS